MEEEYCEQCGDDTNTVWECDGVHLCRVCSNDKEENFGVI